MAFSVPYKGDCPPAPAGDTLFPSLSSCKAEILTMSKTDESTLALKYDSDAHTLTIITPGGNRIVIGDADDSIVIEDQRGNRARFDATGISLNSAGNISIHARGNLSLSADGRIDLASKHELEATGLNLTLAAETKLSAKAGAAAELSSSGQTIIKGAMVLIN